MQRRGPSSPAARDRSARAIPRTGGSTPHPLTRRLPCSSSRQLVGGALGSANQGSLWPWYPPDCDIFCARFRRTGHIPFQLNGSIQCVSDARRIVRARMTQTKLRGNGKGRPEPLCPPLTHLSERSRLLEIHPAARSRSSPPDKRGTPMIQTILSAPTTQKTAVRPTTISPCRHGRMVDEVRTINGDSTGQLICMECLAVFPDPLDQKLAS